MTGKTWKYKLYTEYPYAFTKSGDMMSVTVETKHRSNSKAFFEEIKHYEEGHGVKFRYCQYIGGKYTQEARRLKSH